jgi:hypothetical protein
MFDGTIVYGLIYLDSRWKVERIRPVEGSGAVSGQQLAVSS